MTASTKAPKGGYRIYIVEDSAILLRLLLEILGGIPGAEVIGYSGRADRAMLDIRRMVPDAIIVDLLLESGTGYQVLDAAARQSIKPLAIVLTNFTMAPYRDWAEKLGVAHFFDKSTEILAMSRLIGELVEKHRTKPDLEP